ncbi:hypothetical protein ACOME3_007397 [Neoechinorhynchus agilis]
MMIMNRLLNRRFLLSRISIRTLIMERQRDKGSPISTDPIGDRTAQVDPTEHSLNRLRTCYERILIILSTNFDHSVPYRVHTEKVVQERLELLKFASSPEEFEENVKGGSLEQLLNQAENERNLAESMVKSEAWRSYDPEMFDPPNDQWKWPPLK